MLANTEEQGFRVAEPSNWGTIAMPVTDLLARGDSTHRLLLACQVLAQRPDLLGEVASALSDDDLAAIRSALHKVADHLGSQAPDVSIRLRAWLSDIVPMRLPAVVAPVARISDALMAKVKKVSWEPHKDRKTGKKTHWTAKWEGFMLKITRQKLPGEGVVFVGYIDDLENAMTRGKSLSRVQANVEEEALKRLAGRPKK